MAALFRVIQERHPTLLLDEADTVFNKTKSDSTEDLRGLLNNGYRRGTPYLRVVGEGKKMHVEAFETFTPKAVASIRALPDTVQDRSIVIGLQRRLATEPVERFRFRRAEREVLPLCEHLEALAATLELPEHAACPDGLSDRQEESWEPLLAIADAAGGDWPTRGRHAALIVSGTAELDDERTEIRLLTDIRSIFEERGAERIPTVTLIETLHSDAYAESGWEDWRGRGLKAEGLAYLLRPFGIRAHQMKLAGTNVRGFDRDQFAGAFDRYLLPPVDGPLTRYPGTAEHESEHEGSKVAGESPVAGEGQETEDDLLQQLRLDGEAPA